MKVIGSKVLVQVKKEETCTQMIGNFKLPENNSYETATILGIGEEVKSPIKEGDSILIYPGSGKEIEIEGNKYRVITLNEIIIVL